MTPHCITLEQLIAVRLLSAKAEGDTKGVIKKHLDAFFVHRLSTSAWSERFMQALTSLQHTGMVEQIGKARYKLTEAGVAQNQTLLGHLPKQAQWQSLKNVDLVIYLLQLPMASPTERKRLGSVDGLRGAILKQHYELPISDYPTLTQARDALLWRDTFDPKHATECLRKAQDNIGNRYTLTALTAMILSQWLATDQILAPKNAVNQLVAKIVGAQRIDANELRLALLRSALLAAETSAQPVHTQAFNLDLFAEQVIAAVTSCETGRFGDDKVFISHIHAHMVSDHALTLTLEQFKQRLAEANNQRLLSLAQADLVPAMKQQDVLASELRYLTSVFHFIRC